MDTEISDGVALLESKGCNGCHKARYDLARKLRTKMVNDVAASMWNHAKIRQTTSLNEDEMRTQAAGLGFDRWFRPTP
jgi:hypothetical protein